MNAALENISKRVAINETAHNLTIRIKSHNSLLHASFILAVMLASFSVIVLLFSLLASVLRGDISASILSWSLAGITLAGKALFFIIILRSVLWTAAGSESIVIDGAKLSYSKKIAGMGPSLAVPLAEIQSLVEVEYVQEKDIIQMMACEIGIAGRAFTLKTKERELKFGLYLTMDETGLVNRAFKTRIKS